MKRAVIRAISAVAVAVTCVAVGVFALRPAGAATVTTVDHTVGQAVAYAGSVGVSSGVVVLDDSTGKLYASGNYTGYFGAASVMKLFVAAKLLVIGRMAIARIAAQAWSMITRSDDRALVALLPYVGGDAVINWVKSYYAIPYLGTPPFKRGCWGNTQISAKGIVAFYQRMKHDARVGPWLMNAIHHHTSVAADGTNQTFGIPQAAGGVGVKQGWGQCSSNTNGSVINSTGLVGSNRFAVAILTNTNKWTVNAHSYNATQATVVTRMAKILMPHGFIDLPEAHNPVGHVDSVSAKGSRVTLSGWALDPDLRTSSMTVRVTEGSAIRWQHTTANIRSDINSRYHTTGLHGFRAIFTATNGRHSYCVYLINSGMGNASPRHCSYIVNVNGSPTGALTSASTPGPGQLAVTGWAYDPDVVPAASYVRITLDADTSTAVTVLANQARPAGTYSAAGNHGYGTTLTTTPGSHDVCAVALNAGPAGPQPVAIGCATVTVQSTAPSAAQPAGTPTPAPTTTPTLTTSPTDTPTTTASTADPVPSPSGS